MRRRFRSARRRDNGRHKLKFGMELVFDFARDARTGLCVRKGLVRAGSNFVALEPGPRGDGGIVWLHWMAAVVGVK